MQLTEVCELIVDCEHKTAPTQHEGYPSIRTPNIGRGYFIMNGVNHVSEDTYRLWTRRAVPRAGDLIMAREAPVGNVAMVPLGMNPCLGQRTLLIRPDRAKVEPAYLNYFLNGPDVQGLIRAKTNGATVAHLNMQDVRSMNLPPLPNLAAQRRIAGVLSAYDDLVENCQRRIQILEAMARALYREWFVNFHFPGHEEVPRTESSLGEIPVGWAGRFSNLAVIDRDTVNPFEYSDVEFDHFSIPAFDNGRLPSLEPGASILSAKYRIDGTAVLLSKLNPRIPRVWLPDVRADRIAITSTEFLVLKPRPGMSKYFLYAKCLSEQFLGEFANLANGTSTSHQRVKPENLLALLTIVPDRKTIAEFSQISSPILAHTQILRSQVQKLRRTRDLLLPRLMSGQLTLDVE